MNGRVLPRHERIGALLVAGILLLGACAAIAWSSASAANLSNPAGVIERAEERFRQLRDYECLVALESRRGEKVESGESRFWFKQPRMMRVQVLRGSRKGSVMAMDGSGQIRGRKTGILSGIVKKLKPTDTRLKSLRGSSVLTMDWGSLYHRFRENAARPGARSALAPRDDASAPYEVVVSYTEDGKPVREVYAIDPAQWVLVSGTVYEGDTRVEQVSFREIRLDTGKPDSFFSL
jgi:outer membrane lipoprotein-sorting protein